MDGAAGADRLEPERAAQVNVRHHRPRSGRSRLVLPMGDDAAFGEAADLSFARAEDPEEDYELPLGKAQAMTSRLIEDKTGDSYDLVILPTELARSVCRTMVAYSVCCSRDGTQRKVCRSKTFGTELACSTRRWIMSSTSATALPFPR